MARPSFGARGATSQTRQDPTDMQWEGEPAPRAVARPTTENVEVAQSTDLDAMYLSQFATDLPAVNVPNVAHSVVEPDEETVAVAEVNPTPTPVKKAVERSTANSRRPVFGRPDASASPARPEKETKPQHDEQASLVEASKAPVSDPDVVSSESRPYEKLDEAETGSAQSKRDLSPMQLTCDAADIGDARAAGVIAQAVACIAVSPGSASEVSQKSELMTAMLASCRHSVQTLSGALPRQPVRHDAAKGLMLSSLIRTVAQSWGETGRKIEELKRLMEAQTSLVCKVLGNDADDVVDAVKSIGEQADLDELRFPHELRLVATHEAGWRLGNAVDSVRFGDGEPFLFGQTHEELVTGLLHEVRAVVTATMPDVIKGEVPQALYLRGALERASGLMSAEYLRHAYGQVGWIESSANDLQRKQRHQASADTYVREIRPEICKWVHKNFVAVERAARKLSEEMNHGQEVPYRPGR